MCIHRTDSLSLITLVLMSVSCSGTCPPWTVFSNSSGECQCGDGLDIAGVVHCDRDSMKISPYCNATACLITGTSTSLCMHDVQCVDC